jgi:hypothetical protein
MEGARLNPLPLSRGLDDTSEQDATPGHREIKIDKTRHAYRDV